MGRWLAPDPVLSGLEHAARGLPVDASHDLPGQEGGGPGAEQFVVGERTAGPVPEADRLIVLCGQQAETCEARGRG